jgi:hypothetical protein
MKAKTGIGAIIATLLLGSITFLSGCATTGMERSEKTGTTMMVVEQDIQQAVVQVDATRASLEDLIRPGQSDVKMSFEKYSANVDKMDSLGKRLFEHADKMSAQGKDYFEEWRKQGNTYTNSQIQALSEQRRSDLSMVFAKIPEASVGVKGAFKAYMSDNREIRTYLSNDLTPKGVETITPIAQKAVQDGDNLKESVKPVLSAIDAARAELNQGGTKQAD